MNEETLGVSKILVLKMTDGVACAAELGRTSRWSRLAINTT
jgi:hypothetical protein